MQLISPLKLPLRGLRMEGSVRRPQIRHGINRGSRQHECRRLHNKEVNDGYRQCDPFSPGKRQ